MADEHTPPPPKPVPVIIRWWHQYWYDAEVFRATNRTLFKQGMGATMALLAAGVLVIDDSGVTFNASKLTGWAFGLLGMSAVATLPTQPLTKKTDEKSPPAP